MIVALWVVAILLLAVNGVLIYLLNISTRKNETYETALTRYYARAKYTRNYMKAIDDRGIFENDDEVGEAFTQLRYAIEDLEQFSPDDAAEPENEE